MDPDKEVVDLPMAESESDDDLDEGCEQDGDIEGASRSPPLGVNEEGEVGLQSLQEPDDDLEPEPESALLSDASDDETKVRKLLLTVCFNIY